MEDHERSDREAALCGLVWMVMYVLPTHWDPLLPMDFRDNSDNSDKLIMLRS